MRPALYYYFLLCLFLISTSCAGPALPKHPLAQTRPPAALPLGLSTAADNLGNLIGKSYAAVNQESVLQFISANQHTLLKELETGSVTGVFVHFLEANSPYWFSPVAMDGLVVIVHPDNPVNDLSLSEIRAIFNGQIDNWSVVGGPDSDIRVHVREEGSGTRILFDSQVLASQVLASQVLANLAVEPSALVASGDEAMRVAVSSEPGAIGYSMMANTDKAKILSIDGLWATTDSTAEQRYPFTTPLYYASWQEPVGESRRFLAWLQSPDGQALLSEKYGRIR